MFRTWDELTIVEQLQCTYSDIHKDAYGFRPRNSSDEQWNSAEWLQAEIDKCYVELDQVLAEEAIQQQEAIARFEQRIITCLKAGARDRAMAIRWLTEAEEPDVDSIDQGYFEYLNGLPYGYLAKAAQ